MKKNYIKKIVIKPNTLSLKKSALLGSANMVLFLRSDDMLESTHNSITLVKNEKPSGRRSNCVCGGGSISISNSNNNYYYYRHRKLRS